ncbi:MAG TPA: hypothetical protein VK188_03890 [Holophaga sp.]|nr:hypothetical protein [Holophaga sp.]
MIKRFTARLNLSSDKDGGRNYFLANESGLIGGIPLHLNKWDSDLYITSYLLLSDGRNVLVTPQEITIPMMVSSSEAYLEDLIPGARFILWEGRKTAEGVIIELAQEPSLNKPLDSSLPRVED